MSVFTDVAAEGILLAGGGRAILLQIANPAVGAGVARHSDFANRPLERFANTVTYAYATVFCSPDELAAVVERVNAAHRPVHSSPSEVRYNAFDRDTQLWVAATLYQSAITVYEKVFGPLDDADAEEVYRRYSVLGTSLQVAAESWPPTRAEFQAYWNDALAQLDVTDEARRVASDLLHPRTAPPWLRAVMPLVRLVTAGLLTPQLRLAFVLPWSAKHQRRFDRVFAVAGFIYPRLPLRLRQLPKNRYLTTLRHSLPAR